jgi:putative sigma-54 modulation protein
MEFQLRTLDVPLTDGLNHYIRQRMQKLDRLNVRAVDARFELRRIPQRSGGEMYIAQMTVLTKAAILRAEHRDRDLHLAIDGAVEHMARRMKQFMEKRTTERHRQTQRALEAQTEALLTTEPEIEEEEALPKVVRRKRFPVYPMTEDEAIEQMELLGHDFFVFWNPADEQINVLYRRKDGQYGLIQPTLG